MRQNRKILLILFFLLLCFTSFSQQLFYNDIIYGGVTGGGANSASSPVNINVMIAPNSSIKKAFLIAARDSNEISATVTLNGNNYTFDSTSIVTTGFNSVTPQTTQGSAIHVIDITVDIDSSINNYTLIMPSINGGFIHYYLYIVYENPALPVISCNLFLNTQNVAIFNLYKLNELAPIDTIKPVGLALLTSHFCFLGDGSYVGVNGDTFGLIWGSDASSPNGCGTYANFSHYNDSLFGLDDDTPDSLMNSTDALADIKSYINNNDTTVNVTFTKNSAGGNNLTNPIRLLMLSYSTLCDTFSTTITANDTICLGGSVQLQATGGNSYNWFGAFGGLNDSTLANPMASPIQTTTYVVTITNDSSCVKTEQVKIWVDPCVGIKNKLEISNWNIYPNPTQSHFTIEGITEQYNLTIYNSLGQLLFSENEVLELNKKVDVSNFGRGLIFIRIDADGATSYQKVLIN